LKRAFVCLAVRRERARSPVDRSATERQIGRLLGRNSRVAGRYAIRLIADTAVAGLRSEWSARPKCDARSCHSQGCHLLRLTTTPTLAAKWLLPRLASFRAAHPDIEVRISAGMRLVDLAREGIDVATGRGSAPNG